MKLFNDSTLEYNIFIWKFVAEISAAQIALKFEPFEELKRTPKPESGTISIVQMLVI